MYSPHSDLEKMFWTPNYILFRCLIDGSEYLGRPGDIHMGEVSKQKFKHCSFKFWDSIEQYLSGSMGHLLEEVTSNRVVGLEAIDTLSNKEPSTLSAILSICNDISKIKDDADIGIMRRNIPDLLGRLYHTVQEYSTEHPKAYTESPLYYIHECKIEFDNIDITLLSTDQYRKDKIRNLKEKISTQIHQLFAISEAER